MRVVSLDAFKESLVEELGNKVAFTVPVLGGVPVAESVVVTWIVMAALIALALALTRRLSVDRPGKVQCALEWAVEFLFRPGAGMQARPLARIASGGEVSRVMLAVKVVLGEVDDVDTLVFDEVDAGVGGSTAVALADVLADLARTHQVIVVTHLAQVAVRGQAHYVVRKAAGDEGAMPETDLRQLPESERPAEIARMLSGDATETSLAHAREMLARAAG